MLLSLESTVKAHKICIINFIDIVYTQTCSFYNQCRQDVYAEYKRASLMMTMTLCFRKIWDNFSCFQNGVSLKSKHAQRKMCMRTFRNINMNDYLNDNLQNIILITLLYSFVYALNYKSLWIKEAAN